MNKIVLSTIVLGGLLSYGTQGSPLLYTDYLKALEAPVSDELQQYVLGGADTERVMNILLKQSERVTPETTDVFLDNVRFLLTQTGYASYQSTLRQLNIQTLLLNGEVTKAVAEITSLPPQEQDTYRLLLVMGLMQLNQSMQALSTFNQLSPEVYQAKPAHVLNVAQYMVVDYGVSSQALNIPGGGNEALVLQLADYYERNGLYGKSLSEQTRRLSMMPTLPEQQAYRRSLVKFAREHNLVKDERVLMEAYLKVAVTEPERVIADMDTVNEYSHLLVHYYFDSRNHSKRLQWSDGLLEAQRRLSKTNSTTQQAYLENRIYRYDEERPTFFYTDVVSLATLTQQRSVVSSVFTSSLPNATQQKLLASYFSIPAEPDETSLALADAYSALVEGCDITLPMTVRALKGHRLAQGKQYAQAQKCFSSVVWAQTELSEHVISTLQQEQRQIEYLTMKEKGDESAMVAIAKSGSAAMRFDAAIFAVNGQSMSSARLKYLAGLGVSLALTSEQQEMVDAQIDERLRQSGQMALLVPRLKKMPERHALELAYWSISQDETKAAVDYILMSLTQRSLLTPADVIRIVRYLDSVYPSLPQEVQQQVRQVSNEGVQKMVQLRSIEATLEHAFELETSDTMVSVQQAMTTYNHLKSMLSSAPVANATAQLWLLGQLEGGLSQFLTLQAAQVPDALKPILREQALQRESQYKHYVRQVIDQKVEGVIDVRVLNAVLLMRGW